MKIKSLRLFQTELDSNYENVIDGYDTETEYLAFLSRYYIDIPIEKVKGLKEIDDRITITLPLQYSNFRYYNYARLEYYARNAEGIEYTDVSYYFITSSASLNDSQTPSTILTLDIDVFTYWYLRRLKNENYNDINLVSKRHFEECINGDVLACKMYDTDEEIVETYQPQDNYKGLKVLWARITTGKEIEIGFPDNDAIPTWTNFRQTIHTSSAAIQVRPLNTSMSVNNILYMPICVMEFDGINPPKPSYNHQVAYTRKNLVNGNFVNEYEPTWELLYQELPELSQSPLPMVYGITTESSAVLKIELTYFSPVKYSFELIGLNRELVLYDTYRSYNDGESKFVPLNCAKFSGESAIFSEGSALISKFGSNLHRENGEYLIFGCADYYKNPKYYDERLYPQKTFPLSANIPSHTKGYENCVEYEARMHYFPYYYNTFLVGGQKMFLKPIENDFEQIISIDYFNKTNVYYKIGNSTEIDGKESSPLSSKTNVIQSIDSGNEYLKNNSTSMLVNSVMSLAPSMTSSKMNEVVKGRNPYTGRMVKMEERSRNRSSFTPNPTTIPSVLASYVDAEKATDFVKNYEDNAFNDAYQDSILYAITDIKNECDRERVYSLIHYYGININKYLSLRENYHELYDFVKTTECSITFIPNFEHREIIERMYDRGVTRWHLNGMKKIENYSNNGTNYFNKEFINLSNNQRTYYGEGN